MEHLPDTVLEEAISYVAQFQRVVRPWVDHDQQKRESVQCALISLDNEKKTFKRLLIKIGSKRAKLYIGVELDRIEQLTNKINEL